MVLSCENSYPRFRGTIKEIAWSKRPLCGKCSKPMRIWTHSSARMVVGKDEDYATTTAYYWCGNPACSAFKRNHVHPENPHVPPDGTFDWEVIADVCVLRWSRHCTYEEIVAELATRHGIGMCMDTVERFLKTYEIACEARYRPEYINKILGILFGLLPGATFSMLESDAFKATREHFANLDRDFLGGMSTASLQVYRIMFFCKKNAPVAAALEALAKAFIDYFYAAVGDAARAAFQAAIESTRAKLTPPATPEHT